ncbi:abc transporter substrate-binding protein [Leptolyngbya sp. Heron Island J]|uniref:ABC transporter substrate-binding protein n=1 Tax=Leptolyngbya sp. Heron Island J TaxID=1385935 RepID=UPI0003B9451E|nr:ABC transporter substrate-binding protein [Leptolyngbya sp. Heron Island J]ESA34038.1 abc transporter substrate-binding protein [Leptolyngbya sp. Heron Island J]
MTCDRRQFLQFMTASLGLSITAGCGRPTTTTSNLTSLGIGGSPILLTIPLAYLIERSGLQDAIAEIEFFSVRNHDQIKALLASGQGQITANPTLLAAGLYRQDLPIKLLNVMVWGNIYVLSADGALGQWEDLRGKTVLIPFKGGMPEMIFRFLATQSGLQPDQDLTIQSTQDFQSTAQLLLTGAGDVGVFAEPHASNVVAKAQQQDLELFYSLDFKQTWSQVTGQPARFPQAGISALSSLVDNSPDVVTMIQTELRNSLDWIQQNPTDAAELGAKYMDTPAPILEQSLKTNLFEFVPAVEARPELEVFYQSLMQVNPKLLQGQLPDADFYVG